MRSEAPFRGRLLVLLLSAALSLLASQPMAGAGGESPFLHQFVSERDGYRWSVTHGTEDHGLYTVTGIQMISGEWQGTLWKHHIVIIVPAVVQPSNPVSLFVTGDNGRHRYPEELTLVALATQAPVVVLYDIPNQPLFGRLREDALIAYTFNRFMETGDPSWPALLPMTRAVIRCMDAVDQYLERELAADEMTYLVTGASKRGWTTWLALAAEPQGRIIGIAPMVYDNLNIRAQMENQLEIFGRYSEQISDYALTGLLDELESEEGEALLQLVDPYSYVDSLTAPKLIVIGTNDRYWPLNALSLYYDDLVGTTRVLYVPNGGHSLGDMEKVIRSYLGFYLSIAGYLDFREIGVELRRDPITGYAQILAPAVRGAAYRLFAADSDSLDFRDSTWSVILETDRGMKMETEVEPRAQGYRAVLVEIQIGSLSQSMVYTTQPLIFGSETESQD